MGLAKVGRNVEISSSDGISTDRLEVGDQCFIADSCMHTCTCAHACMHTCTCAHACAHGCATGMIGSAVVHRGMVSVRPVKIEDKAFIGNGSFVPEGATVPSGTLIALQTLAPYSAPKCDMTFLGSPPLDVGARELDVGRSANLNQTYQPSRTIVSGRYAFEALGFALLHLIKAGFLTALVYTPHRSVDLNSRILVRRPAILTDRESE